MCSLLSMQQAQVLVNPLVSTLFAAMRERLAIADVPAPFKGTAIALIAAGIMSMAFMGFAGFTGNAI